MTTPRISIILPVYNAEKYLEECLKSILIQTFKDIEILCINDGSKDRSLEILNDYAAKDNRIKVFNQENSGPAKARNVGLENAHGEFLMFCDADDTYEPTMCENMLTTIQTEQVDLVMCDVNMLEIDKNHGRDKNTINYHRLHQKEKHPITFQLKTKLNVLLWNKIFKTELIKKYNLSFPTGFEYDDNAFIWEYLSISRNFYGLDKKLYNYKILNNSIMGKIFAQKKTNKIFDEIYAIKHFMNFLKENNLLLNNTFLIWIINTSIDYATHHLDTKQQKEYIKKLSKELLPTINGKNFKNLTQNKDYLEICKKITAIKHCNKIFGMTKFQNTKKYYILGFPILKKEKTDTTKTYYLFGIKVFCKKKK